MQIRSVPCKFCVHNAALTCTHALDLVFWERVTQRIIHRSVGSWVHHPVGSWVLSHELGPMLWFRMLEGMKFNWETKIAWKILLQVAQLMSIFRVFIVFDQSLARSKTNNNSGIQNRRVRELWVQAERAGNYCSQISYACAKRSVPLGVHCPLLGVIYVYADVTACADVATYSRLVHIWHGMKLEGQL